MGHFIYRAVMRIIFRLNDRAILKALAHKPQPYFED